jgi:hypothetical protein
MTVRHAAVAAAIGLLLAIPPVWAHHSFAAEYDGNKPITIKGTVNKVDWVNPHSWVRVDVVGADGKVEQWACETAPPNILYRQGWRKDSLKPGDQVTIDGFPAKDSSNTMNARSVTLANGRKMFAGSATDGSPPSSPNSK